MGPASPTSILVDALTPVFALDGQHYQDVLVHFNAAAYYNYGTAGIRPLIDTLQSLVDAELPSASLSWFGTPRCARLWMSNFSTSLHRTAVSRCTGASVKPRVRSPRHRTSMPGEATAPDRPEHAQKRVPHGPALLCI